MSDDKTIALDIIGQVDFKKCNIIQLNQILNLFDVLKLPTMEAKPDKIENAKDESAGRDNWEMLYESQFEDTHQMILGEGYIIKNSRFDCSGNVASESMVFVPYGDE